MIQTKTPIYPTRGLDLVPVNIEIIAIQDEFEKDNFKFIIGDYIIYNEVKKYISDRIFNLTYSQRDNLKNYILSNFKNGEIEGLSESEVNKFILPYALLHFVTNDFIDVETQTLIYNTQSTDWQIV